ncbi:MAG: hypothetical protein HRK26_00755 [Rickettsiaceae bacterium H1]|nr:hypothetical protein [Rickettsiaceae bacterium H1]
MFCTISINAEPIIAAFRKKIQNKHYLGDPDTTEGKLTIEGHNVYLELNGKKHQLKESDINTTLKTLDQYQS